MGELILDHVVFAEGWSLHHVGGGEGRRECIVIIEVDKVSISASVPPSSLCIPSGAVSSEVSLLSAVKAGTSSPGRSVLRILGPVGVSDFHESSIHRVRLVGLSLVAVHPGAVEVHRDCQVVHVLGGIERVVLGSPLVPRSVPIVARGVLLEVLVRSLQSVVELSILEELTGSLSSSCEGFEYLFRLGYVDGHVSVLLVGRVGNGVGCL